MIFRPHTPGFIDRDPEPPTTFETKAELEAAPQVARFIADTDLDRLSISANESVQYLMAEFKDGSHRVVGYITQGIVPREWYPDWKPRPWI